MCRCRSITWWGGSSGPGGRRRGGLPRALAGVAPGDERAVLANQQLEVFALLLGELEEDLLAFGVLEPLAVALEELVRAALAADADAQRLGLVHAGLAQLLGAFGEQAVGRALEEQERRLRFELRVALEQGAVARLEPVEVIDLLFGQLLEDMAAAAVLDQARRPGIELTAAALGGDGDAHRVAGEQQLRVAGLGLRRRVRPGRPRRCRRFAPRSGGR